MQAFAASGARGLELEIHGSLESYHGDSSYADAVRALASREERIRLCGPYPLADLPRILARLDGVAVPSLWEEVFGLTSREAAAAGLPVLARAVGGLAELPFGALVAREEGQDAWIEVLRRFESDPAAREAWRGRPSDVRTAGDMAEQIETIYFRVLRGRRGAHPGNQGQA
jgi:glycosyltransferase involved in cell wall biosynthesis